MNHFYNQKCKSQPFKLSRINVYFYNCQFEFLKYLNFLIEKKVPPKFVLIKLTFKIFLKTLLILLTFFNIFMSFLS